MLVGAVFLLVGILGFIPGITTNYDDLSFAGHDSDAKLLGIFQVSVLHNIVGLFSSGKDTGVNWIPLNWADTILHLVLGLGMVGLGLVAGRPDYRERPAAA